MMKRLTLEIDNFTVLVCLESVTEVVSLLLLAWEASRDNLGVGEQDSIEGEASSLDWVLVHFY